MAEASFSSAFKSHRKESFASQLHDDFDSRMRSEDITRREATKSLLRRREEFTVHAVGQSSRYRLEGCDDFRREEGRGHRARARSLFVMTPMSWHVHAFVRSVCTRRKPPKRTLLLCAPMLRIRYTRMPVYVILHCIYNIYIYIYIGRNPQQTDSLPFVRTTRATGRSGPCMVYFVLIADPGSMIPT